MTTRKKQTKTATTDYAARTELTGLLHGLSNLFTALERELWTGKYRTAINDDERKNIHGACEGCLDALTEVFLLPPPPEVGQRILDRFREAAMVTGDDIAG